MDTRLREQTAQFRSELAELERRMTMRFGTVTVAAIGAASAIVPWIHLDTSAFTYTAAQPVEYASSPDVMRTFCGR